MDDQLNFQPKKVDDTWAPENEKILIDILVEEVNTGRTVKNGVPHTRRWTPITNTLTERSGRVYTVPQVKNKFHKLRTRHREFSELLAHTGFGWDPISNTVTASDDCWNSYINAHPNASKYRTKGCLHYDELGIIFNKSTATGMLRQPSNVSPPNSPDMHILEDEFMNSGVHVDYNSPDENQVPPAQNETQGQSSHRTRKRTRSFGSEMGESYTMALNSWAECYKAKAEWHKIRAAREQEATTAGMPERTSIENCVFIVRSMIDPLVDRELYVKACKAMVDRDLREVFYFMEDEASRLELLKGL